MVKENKYLMAIWVQGKKIAIETAEILWQNFIFLYYELHIFLLLESSNPDSVLGQVSVALYCPDENLSFKNAFLLVVPLDSRKLLFYH